MAIGFVNWRRAETLPYLSESTVGRMLKVLSERGLVQKSASAPRKKKINGELQKYVEKYNNFRSHNRLRGMTPMEAQPMGNMASPICRELLQDTETIIVATGNSEIISH